METEGFNFCTFLNKMEIKLLWVVKFQLRKVVLYFQFSD